MGQFCKIVPPGVGENSAEKPDLQTPTLESIDPNTLTPLAQGALDDKEIEVLNFAREQLHSGIGAGTAVYRFSGEESDRHRTIPWSLILKVLQPGGGSTDSSAWDYFKREADAYQSGWLDELSGGLAAPRFFGVINHPDGTCWMWLEDIRDIFGSQWPLEHYGVVARHLGRFNGFYLAGRPLPGWPWLSSNWIRHYVEQSAPAIEPLRNSLANPWVKRWLPESDSDQFFQLWEERNLYLDAFDRLPQTICHFDVVCRNLFARRMVDGGDQTVVIDWAFVGRGPIGADLNPLIMASIALSDIGLDKAQELEDIVIKAYLAGLRDASW